MAMKYLLVAALAVGVIIGALTNSATTLQPQRGSAQHLARSLPKGYCALSSAIPAEAALVEANAADAAPHGLTHMASFMWCEDLAKWRRGGGIVLRMGSLFSLPAESQDRWGFVEGGSRDWNGSALHAALDKQLAQVLAGTQGGDLGLQVQDQAARFRLALEPLEVPELSLKFVGLLLAARLDQPANGRPLLLLMSEPYQDPDQVMTLYKLGRDSLRRLAGRSVGS